MKRRARTIETLYTCICFFLFAAAAPSFVLVSLSLVAVSALTHCMHSHAFSLSLSFGSDTLVWRRLNLFFWLTEHSFYGARSADAAAAAATAGAAGLFWSLRFSLFIRMGSSDSYDCCCCFTAAPNSPFGTALLTTYPPALVLFE